MTAAGWPDPDNPGITDGLEHLILESRAPVDIERLVSVVTDKRIVGPQMRAERDIHQLLTTRSDEEAVVAFAQ